MNEYLTFNVGERTFGIDVADVHQVVRAATLSKVSVGDDRIEGLLNLRGEVVPVVDLRVCLGVQQPSMCDTDYLLIIHDHHDRAFAIRSNNEVQLVAAEQVARADGYHSEIQTRDLLRVDNQLVPLLVPDQMTPHSGQHADHAPGETRG